MIGGDDLEMFEVVDTAKDFCRAPRVHRSGSGERGSLLENEVGNECPIEDADALGNSVDVLG